MNGVFTWLIIGVVVYLLFFRRGGMGMGGCCGGHDTHGHDHNHDSQDKPVSAEPHTDEIIDLRKDQYTEVTKTAQNHH